jgi:ribosomal protein L3
MIDVIGVTKGKGFKGNFLKSWLIYLFIMMRSA